MTCVTLYGIQSSISWQQPEHNRQHYAELIARCHNADVIVLPEMFTTGFSMASQDIGEPAEGETLQWLRAQAAQYNTAITGSIAVNVGKHRYNRMYWVTPDAQVDYYDKRHLFRMGGEHEHFTPGQERKIVAWRGLRFCLQVCYDLRFPVFSRNRGDYDVLIYIANWPASRVKAWSTLLPARAIENQAYVIGVNRIGQDGKGNHYNGESAIYDFTGGRLASSEENGQSILRADIELSALETFREKFPVWMDADEFTLQSPAS